MANLSRSLSTFLVIVGFLVLTALAAVLYGGSTAQQEKMKQNFFWQGARQVSDALWALAGGLGKVGSDKSKQISENQEIDKEGDNNLWLNFKARLEQEWPDSETSSRVIDENRFLRWQRTETGAEIIFRSESGREHKLPLPFKFLGL